MVRINLIDPKKLADQHLVAEYNETLMLFGYVTKFPAKKDIPSSYCLGSGHIRFFKDKLSYLERRHRLIKAEMKDRGFATNKTINLSSFPKELCNDWVPNKQDFTLIKTRLIEKLDKKPDWYRYYGESKNAKFFKKLLN